MDAHDILFIYNEKETKVDEIVSYIRNLDYKTFFWRDNVPVGERANGAEEEMLEAVSNVVIVLGNFGWGPNHLRLAELAIEQGKKIIPVLIGKPPLEDLEKSNRLFIDQRYVDLLELHATGFNQLLNAIGPKIRHTSPESFSNFLDQFLEGKDEVRSEMLRTVHRLRPNRKTALGKLVITALEKFQLEEPEIRYNSDQDFHLHQSEKSWLTSLLIWTLPTGFRSKAIFFRQVNIELERDENIRFWTLAGLYQAGVDYLKDVAKIAEINHDAAGQLASAILRFDDGVDHYFHDMLHEEDSEDQKQILKVLRIFPAPGLVKDLIELLDHPEIRYDVLYALANPELREHLLPLRNTHSAKELMEIIFSISLETPKIHIQNFASILRIYSANQIEQAITFFEEDKNFIQQIRKGIGLAEERDEENIPSAGYISDQSGAEYDLLDIGKDVSTLSALMLSNAIDPPLAIGLFGNWGTGKSFFMDALELACEALIKKQKIKEKSSFHTDVVQIRFNAWNYSDANLWASLVHHIFDSLSHFVTPPKTETDTLAQYSAFILEKEQLIIAAQEKIHQQGSVLLEKETTLTNLQEARVNKPINLQELNMEDYWFILNEDQKSGAKKLMSELGLTDLHASVKDMQAIIDEAKTVRGRFLGILAWLFSNPNRWLKIFILVAIFLFVPLSVYLIRTIWPNLWGNIGSIIFQVATIISTIVLYGKQGLRYINEGLVVIEQTKAKVIEVLERKRIEATKEEVDLQHDIAQLKTEKQQQQQFLDQAELALKGSLLEKQQFEIQISLGSFLTERKLSIDYGKHLGIITTIRKDFKVLIDKLSTDQYALHGKKVSRIILYIDDLDRCQPQKVFEVLQAVHLLLAYKLFVVVVGVDPDWMTDSLEFTYKQFQNQKNNNKTKHATPQHFIEKIFQIPFNLKPLSSGAFPGLMNGLFKSAMDKKKEAATHSEEITQEKTQSNGRIQQKDETNQTNSAERSSTHQNQINEPEKAINTNNPAGSERQRSNQKIVNNLENLDDLQTSNLLKITDEEMLYAGKLFAFIKTPRSAKRFVNIYRLLKVGVGSEDLELFEGNTFNIGQFQLPMLLLAIVVGLPEDATNLLPVLYNGAKKDSGISDTLDLYIISDGTHNSPINLCKEILRITEEQWFPDSADLLLKWVPRVARFSFQPIPLDVETK